MRDRVSPLEFKHQTIDQWLTEIHATSETSGGSFAAAGRSAARVAEAAEEHV